MVLLSIRIGEENRKIERLVYLQIFGTGNTFVDLLRNFNKGLELRNKLRLWALQIYSQDRQIAAVHTETKLEMELEIGKCGVSTFKHEEKTGN